MTHHVGQMLDTHPLSTTIDQQLLSDAIATLTACADSCTACADACLAEEQVENLRRCIRLNLDCAQLCRTTAALLVRQTEPDLEVVRATVRACVLARHSCGDECERHADSHAHCRVCADACNHCADTCERILEAFASRLEADH